MTSLLLTKACHRGAATAVSSMPAESVRERKTNGIVQRCIPQGTLALVCGLDTLRHLRTKPTSGPGLYVSSRFPIYSCIVDAGMLQTSGH